MAKISGSYQSLSRGVSQQVPEARLDGQHSEQVNMISDPVSGLARRHGTKFAHERRLPNLTPIPTSGPTRDCLRAFKTFDFTIDGNEYTLLYNSKKVEADPAYPGITDFINNTVSCVEKTPRTDPNNLGGFTEVQMTASAKVAMAQGISAATQIGRYILLAPTFAIAQGAAVDSWLSVDNRRKAVIWVRGGAYSRKFKVTTTLDGSVFTGEFTTTSASYPGVLDTSDIPYGDAEYTKKVNDRVNAYNSAVTAWIGTAGAQTQPPYIAAQLAASLNGATGNGGIFYADGAHIYVNWAGLSAVTGDDGGDGTLLRVCHMTVKSAELVTDAHYNGKTVQVQASEGEPAYYLKAVAIDGVSGAGQVRWEEAPRITMPPANSPFLFGTIQQPGYPLQIAESPAALRALTGGDATLPDIGTRAVGDDESSPTPHFWGKAITYLGTFQDRLVVAAGAVVSMSETSNYLNFFRSSTLTVKDSDPVEVFALGAEDDTIRHSVIFDKSLLLFGDKQQYSIDGRIPVTPATTTVIQSSAVEGASDAKPVAIGDLVFYGKRREGTSQLYQVEIGDVQDTSNAGDVGLQLSDYMPGKPVEVVATSAPNLVLVRTSGAPRSIFVFRYIDRRRERLLDSWSRFDYGPEFGEIMGMSTYDDKLVLFTHREATVNGEYLPGVSGGYSWLAVDTQSLMSGLSEYPYLDSWRSWNAFVGTGANPQRQWHNQPFLSVAATKASPFWLYGQKPAAGAADALVKDFPTITANDLVVGLEFPSFVALTSPFRRDSKDIALTVGRLTVNKLDITYRDTGGFYADVVTQMGTQRVLSFNGRQMGSPTNLVGVQPVSTGATPCFIGRDSRQYTIYLGANDWQPFTLTSIGWTGQWFYNAQRA
jgi:hypothetical protein